MEKEGVGGGVFAQILLHRSTRVCLLLFTKIMPYLCTMSLRDRAELCTDQARLLCAMLCWELLYWSSSDIFSILWSSRNSRFISIIACPLTIFIHPPWPCPMASMLHVCSKIIKTRSGGMEENRVNQKNSVLKKFQNYRFRWKMKTFKNSRKVWKMLFSVSKEVLD